MNKLTRNIIFYIVFTICLLLITTPLIKNNLMRKTIKFEPYTGRTIGTATDLNNCTYTTDDVNKTITITKFDSSQMSTDKELNVFGQYKLDDITYSTIIESNGEGSLFPTTLSSLYFRGEEVKWKGNAEYLFKNYKNLTSVYFGNTNYIDSSNTSFKGMFSGCSNLVVVEFENANFERVTDISYMFENCIELTNTFNTLEFGNFTASNVTNMSHMFDGCEKLINIDISKFNTSKVTDMSYMFNGCSELTQLNLDNFITDKVTDMSGMFVNCSKLTTLNLNHFNTSRVINMSYMFSRCSALKSINIGNWNTSRVEKMDYLFYECSSLTNIDIDSWDTSNVYWMQGMFAYCRKLNSIDLNSWNTSKVTWTDSMFAGCTNLTDINIKDWDVSKVQTIGSMFLDCYSLVNIDISKWSNSISNDYDDMFKNCSKIEMLDISNLEIIGIGGANMFEGCNFDILVTPKSILEYGEYRLPYIMYDDYGIGYTELPTTSKTLYKERPIPKYKVTLETNGGEINSGEVTQYTEGEEVTLPEDVTKEGYNFAGWYDNEGLTGSPVTSIPSTATGDKTFYAKWERNTFTVTFKDGTERTNVQTVNSGENATAPNWTKPGYTLTWDKTFTNVTTDITVNAIWIAKTNTAYTVEHHLQNLSKTAYEKDAMATENRTGTTNTQTAAIAKTYTGFTAQPIEQKTISGNGTTVVIVKYNRNTYTITLNPSEGTLPEGSQIIEYIYGEEKELPDPIRPGYNFDGWYDEEGNEIEKITPTDDGDKQLEANWTAKTDTPYKIIHHFRNLDLESEGFINEEEAKTGTTGTQVTAQYKEREGFTKNESDTRTVKEGIIAGDGSLVLHLYYTRNTYNIEYELNGGTINGSLTNKYVYGKEMFLQTNKVTREGYEFAGWYDNEELSGNPVTSIPNTAIGDKKFYAKWSKNIFTVTFKDGMEREEVQTINRGENATAPNWTKPGYTLTWDVSFENVISDLIVNAQWEARTDTPYKVVHHFRNLDLESEGFINEEELLIGTTATQATAQYKEREGFTKNESDTRTVKEGIIAGDGSLVLHLYYTRNTYNIEYELNGGTINGSLTNKYVYGKEMFLQNNRVIKPGYTFAGWYDNEELSGSPVTSIPNTATGNKKFYAKWIDVEQEYYILSEVYNIDLTENIITKVSPQTSIVDFLSKIETNGTCKVLNLKGQEVTGSALVGTGYKLQVNFKGKVHTYEIAVRGDLDGNGKITTTDLSIINQQILHKIELTGIKKKAADTDYNGKLTTTDLSMINQAVLRKITL